MQKYNPQDLTFIQSRAETDPSIITEYAEMMKNGVEFDPADGVRDENGNIYIWDGQHRGEAAKMAGIKLAVNLQPGDRSQAEWLALTANQKHGLRRTREDKRRVGRLALQHSNGAALSDREIARHCGVDHKTVGKIRQELELSGKIPQIKTRQVTRKGTTYSQNTAHINKEKSRPTTRGQQVKYRGRIFTFDRNDEATPGNAIVIQNGITYSVPNSEPETPKSQITNPKSKLPPLRSGPDCRG